MNFMDICDRIIDILVDEKKIELSELLVQQFSLPAERIMKFLKLIKRNLNLKRVQSKWT
jgi:hypothetical protein